MIDQTGHIKRELEETKSVYMVCLATSVIFGLISCHNFSEFDCFNQTEGCHPPPTTHFSQAGYNISGAMMSAGTSTSQMGGIMAGEQILAGMTTAGGQMSGGQMMGGQMMGGQMMGGQMMEGQMMGGQMMGGQMMGGQIAGEQVGGTMVGSPPIWCTTNQQQSYSLMLSNNSLYSFVVQWACIQGPNDYYQMMVGEVTIGQILHILDDLDICDEEEVHPLKGYCRFVENIRNIPYFTILQPVYNDNIRSRNTHLYNLPINYIQIDGVYSVIEYLNESNSDFDYDLPQYTEWMHLLDYSNEEDYSCNYNGGLTGVFKLGSDDGCGYGRPRSIQQRLNQEPSCSDDLSETNEDRSFRSINGSLLCDIYGNQREILSTCGTSGQCTVGRGWKDELTFSGDPQAALDFGRNTSSPSIGFRLVRRAR